MKTFLRNSLLLTSLAFAGITLAQVTPFSINADADGFNGWTPNHSSGNGSENGNFIGTSGTGLDVNSDAWGLYANNGQTAALVYEFGATLGVGQSVEIGVSLGFINSGGTVGFGLQNSSAANRFEAYYIGGSTDAWKINDLGGQEDITGPTTTFASSSWSNSNFLTFRFTQLTGDAYSLSVNGTSITNSNLNLQSSDITQIRIFNANAGSGSDHNQYFNNLSVIPEPSSILMMGLAGLAAGGVTVLKRRKRS